MSRERNDQAICLMTVIKIKIYWARKGAWYISSPTHLSGNIHLRFKLHEYDKYGRDVWEGERESCAELSGLIPITQNYLD